METVFVVAHHRNHHQSYSRNRGNGASKGGSFGSASGGHFHGVSCRTFQPGSGLFLNQLKSYSTAAPVTKRAFSSFSPKSLSPPVKVNQKSSKTDGKNCSYPIPIDIKFEDNKRVMNDDDFNICERWAGPTYSNSPPPSSLPIPTFSVQPRQPISFDLDSSISEIGLRFTVKSVPTSPTRDHISLDGDILDSADTATKTLRRILNLDITDS